MTYHSVYIVIIIPWGKRIINIWGDLSWKARCECKENRGTKRLVSVHICSVEGNSAGIFVSKVSPGIFAINMNQGKMNAYHFREDKTAVLGALKAQLPFSEGRYQLLNSWSEFPFPVVFYHLNFQLPQPNRSNSVSSNKYPFKTS